MSERKVVVVVIGRDGGVVAEAAGFRGEACREATGRLLADLAGARGEEAKAEMWEACEEAKRGFRTNESGGS